MDQQPNSFNPPRLNNDPVPPASYMSMVLWKNIILVWTFPIFPSASILGRLISWVFHVRSLNRFILRRYNAFFIHFQVHERFIFMSSICARLRYSFSLCYNHSIRTFFLIFSPVLHWAASHWHEYHIPTCCRTFAPMSFWSTAHLVYLYHITWKSGRWQTPTLHGASGLSSGAFNVSYDMNELSVQ